MRTAGIKAKKARTYGNIVCMLLFVYLLFITSVGKTSELTTQQQILIQNHLDRLENIVNQSKRDLAILNNQLIVSQEELSKAKERLQRLNIQLQELTAISTKQQESLQSAEKYCKKLEQNQAPLTLNEYGIKLDATNHFDGVALGKYWKLPQRVRYIGVRGTYDWDEQKSGLWLTVLI